MRKIDRRTFTKMAGAAGVASAFALSAGARVALGKSPQVVVIGGGFGGATAAKYLRRFDPGIEVTLIEPDSAFITCPFSNTVIGGLNTMARITQSYDGLRAHGVNVVHDRATGIDAGKRSVSLSNGGDVGYDRLIVSPGISFRWDAIEGYDAATSQTIPHAWQAGPQTVMLQQLLAAMPDGGVFIISPPVNPFRCPPGPGERISLVANYFKKHKPRSKILVLDPKEKFSKQGLFKEGWASLYGDMIEYRNASNDGTVIRIDAANMTLHTDFEQHKGDVINFIPPQKAGEIAQIAGLANDSGWCPVNQQTFESSIHPNIHVIGDASIAAPMPKSGFSASNQAKAVAAAVANLVKGEAPGTPKFVNTCYSLVAPDYGISVAMVYDFADGKIVKVEGSGGLSPSGASAEFHKSEANFARGWYDSISQDIWG
jgi:sulfide dehydrogenase [flavocytochrome c] flavoprotein subunit